MGAGDFTAPTREHLKVESGGRCCAPWCGGDTDAMGSAGKKTSVGEAAHIRGNNDGRPPRDASSAARTKIRRASARYDSNMTNEQRAHAHNGIWMCKNHHKVIDDDPDLYPAGLLTQWKKAAARAQVARVKRISLPEPGLFTAQMTLRHEREIDVIRTALDEFMKRSGVGSAWGDVLASHVSGLWAELALNAFTHGAAATARVKTTPTSIKLEYDEKSPFGSSELLDATEPRGGAGELRLWNDYVSPEFVLTDATDGATRTWVVTNLATAPNLHDPCTVMNPSAADFRRLSGCGSIHVVVHRISLSGSRLEAAAILASAQRVPVMVTFSDEVDRRRLLALVDSPNAVGVSVVEYGERVLYLAPSLGIPS